MTPLELALTSEEKMDAYLEIRTNSELIKDIKVYSNADRTVIATACLQGLCANYLREGVTGWGIDTYTNEAVMLADSLIDRLKK